MSQPIAHRANVAALIPCYFEEKNIREVAGRAMKQLDLVLAVDDGSTDRRRPTGSPANRVGFGLLMVATVVVVDDVHQFPRC